MQKKILILSSSFYPNISPRSFRTTELAKEFARQGHEVVVYTRKEHNNYNKIEKEFNITINDYGKFKLKIIKIKGTKIGLFARRAINRILLQLIDYPNIEFVLKVIKVLKNEFGYDLLISIAVPHQIHWGVALFGKNKLKKVAGTWVADCGDPYMGCMTNNFKKMPYFQLIEKLFCKNVDYISVPTKNAINGYYPQFKNKIKVIPQGFCFDNIKIYQGKVYNSRPTFGYSGSFIPNKRDPKNFIKYLNSTNRNYHFIIYSDQHEMLKNFGIINTNKIEIRSYIERNELLYILSQMDFLVNFENDTDIQTPSKLIDYALTKRPILSVKNEANNFKVIDEFLDGNYQNSTNIINIEQYNIKNIVNTFIGLCK